MEQQQAQQQQQILPPFRLYGLMGCSHCVEAQEFLNKERLPALIVLGNDDPIAEAGIKAITNKEVAAFPVLVCTFNKQIIEGYKVDEYRKLADAFHVLFGTSTPNVPGSGQQSQSEVPAAVEVAATPTS